MDKLSTKYREQVKLLGYIGIGAGYIGLIIISFFLLPAKMHGLIRALGNTAKWASEHGSVFIDQTVLLFFRPLPFVVFSLIASEIAGTSIRLKQHFLNEAYDYQQDFSKFF